MCHGLCYSVKQVVFLSSFKYGETKAQKGPRPCLNSQSCKVQREDLHGRSVTGGSGELTGTGEAISTVGKSRRKDRPLALGAVWVKLSDPYSVFKLPVDS